MSVNFRVSLSVFLFICLAGVLFGQEADSRLKHRIAWTKDEYALRYEVLIEKQGIIKYTGVLREFTEDPFLLVSLPPGNYRLRVIAYDFRDVPGEGTKWKNFKVVAGKTKNSESRLVMEDAPAKANAEAKAPANAPAKTEAKAPANATANAAEADGSARERRRDLFAGLFAEGLGYTRYSAAFGGGIVFGGSFNNMGAGITLLYAQDPEKFIFMEALAHFRMYFLHGLLRTKTNSGLFAQAEGGIVLFAYEKPDFTDHIAPTIGLAAGWRFPLGTRWYIEPAIRGGYPYLFGGGVSGGIKFY